MCPDSMIRMGRIRIERRRDIAVNVGGDPVSKRFGVCAINPGCTLLIPAWRRRVDDALQELKRC